LSAVSQGKTYLVVSRAQVSGADGDKLKVKKAEALSTICSAQASERRKRGAQRFLQGKTAFALLEDFRELLLRCSPVRRLGRASLRQAWM
jgi:hypothetical protein